MKIVIDISKDRYDEIMAMDWVNCRRFFDEEIRAIHDGKALEQEPCDAVSREKVLQIVRAWFDRDAKPSELKNEIENLPSVTPAEKVGRWIKHSDNVGNWWECDQCGTDWGGAVNYCPNCGAKMEEVDG